MKHMRLSQEAANTTTSATTKKINEEKTMPNCSSFQDLTTLMSISDGTDEDLVYYHWKRAFEQPRDVAKYIKDEREKKQKRRAHNISGAISGNVTPKGFPSYTSYVPDTNEDSCSKTKPMTAATKEATKKTHVTELHINGTVKMYKLTQLQSSPREQMQKVPSAEANTAGPTFRIAMPWQGHPMLRPSYSAQSPFQLLHTLPMHEQAMFIEKLYRDIKIFETQNQRQIETDVA